MNGASQLRGLSDLRTSGGRSGFASPQRSATVHLERFRLEAERLRLEAELGLLLRRAGRIERRMREIDAAVGRLPAGASDPAPPTPPTPPAPSARPPAGGWRRVAIHY